MDFAGRLIAGFMVIIMVTIFPLQYIAGQYIENLDIHLDNRTRELTDTIRDKGYIDQKMYEDYVHFLDKTGERYEVSIEDIHPVTGEELSQTSGSNPMTPVSYSNAESKAELLSNTNKLILTTDDEESNLAGVEHKDSSGFENLSNVSDLRTFSISEDANSISLFSTHTHTDDCYSGHRHTAACIQQKQVYMNYQFSSTAYVGNSGTFSVYCATCGNLIMKLSFSRNDSTTSFSTTYYYNNNGVVTSTSYSSSSYFVSNTTAYKNDVNSTISTFHYYFMSLGYKTDYANYGSSSTSFSYTSNVITWGGYAIPCFVVSNYVYTINNVPWIGCIQCPLYNCGYTEDTTLECDQVVTSITATSPNQTIKYGDEITATATATYLDGHTGTVNCTVSGFSKTEIGAQTAYLTYSGLVDTAKTTGTKTCSIAVTVNNYITTMTPVTPNQTIFYGGTIDNRAVMTFANGTSEILYCNVVNIQNNTIGTQTGGLVYVTENINYKDCYGNNPSCWLTVTVKDYVTSIIATSPSQTIRSGGTIDTTATITKASGGTVLVACTASGFINSTVGTQTVTLTYTGMVTSSNTYPTCTITVIVLPNKNLSYITATPASQTIPRYTAPGITVKAFFDDGTSAVVTGYTISGFTSSTIGTQVAVISYKYETITKSTSININVTPMTATCPVCGKEYYYSDMDVDPGCPYCKDIVKSISVTPEYLEVEQGAALPVTVQAFYNDGSYSTIYGWTSNYNPNLLGIQAVTIEYSGFTADLMAFVNEACIICPVCGTHYPATDNSCPSCAETVISISASPAEITVVQYAEIPLIVTAYYRNGSSKVVTDWSIDRTAADPGTYNATVTYRNVSTTITLVVTADNEVTCPICGTVYNPWDNPKGCPVCSNQIVGIEAYLTSGSNLVQVGSTPSISVVLIFKDTHRELVEEGYTIDDFNSALLGEQTITIMYHEFYTSLDIVVVDTLACVTCPNGHVYYLNEDGSDPGCPYCNVEEDISNVLYYEVTGTADILEMVYSNGKYEFASGNLVTIELVKKENSFLLKAQNIYPEITLLGRRRKFICGGEVTA